MNSLYHLARNRTWATMIELIAVMAIMGLGIGALLQTLGWGIYYAKNTEDNIKAINIAREWIEWMINIRDTNWLRFSSDKTNCWKTKDYAVSCIGTPTFPDWTAITPWNISSWSYTLFPRNGVWFLSGVSSVIDFSTNWAGYKDAFKIWFDSEWFYTQTGVSSTPCSSYTQTGCLTIFAREIVVGVPPTDTWTLNISSIVRWYDKRPQSVILNSTITNWKSNF